MQFLTIHDVAIDKQESGACRDIIKIEELYNRFMESDAQENKKNTLCINITNV